MFLTNVEGLTPDTLGDYKKISYSEMGSLTRCKKQWDYRYRQGLSKPQVASYLSKGTYLHKFMELCLTGEADHDTLVQNWDFDKDGDIHSLPHAEIQTLQQQAIEVAESLKGEEIIGTEVEFVVDFGMRDYADSPVLLHGFVDAVLRRDDGSITIVEFKTAGRAWSDDQFNFTTQHTLYGAAIATLLGETVGSAAYFIFLAGNRTNPNGRIEHRNIFFTPDMFNNALVELDNVQKMRDNLLDIGVFPREVVFGCGGCPFQEVCRTHFAGGDTEFILQTNFVVDEGRAGRYNVVDS